jgi:hypothetical protein
MIMYEHLRHNHLTKDETLIFIVNHQSHVIDHPFHTRLDFHKIKILSCHVPGARWVSKTAASAEAQACSSFCSTRFLHPFCRRRRLYKLSSIFGIWRPARAAARRLISFGVSTSSAPVSISCSRASSAKSLRKRWKSRNRLLATAAWLVDVGVVRSCWETNWMIGFWERRRGSIPRFSTFIASSFDGRGVFRSRNSSFPFRRVLDFDIGFVINAGRCVVPLW